MDLFGSLWSFFVSCFWQRATFMVRAVIPHLRRQIGPAILAIVFVITGWFCWHIIRGRWVLDNPSPGPTIEQIRGLSELVTAKVTIADARETTLSGYLGNVTAVLVIRGDVLLGPDLSQARLVSFDQADRLVTIQLPPPHVISYRLDHSATRLVSMSHDGLWLLVPGDAGRTAVLNRAYAEGERAVAEAAMKLDTIREAAENAQRALGAFFATGGWKVQVKWQAE